MSHLQPIKPHALRSLICALVICTFSLNFTSTPVNAQNRPAPKTNPGKIERTPEDLAAIRQLEREIAQQQGYLPPEQARSHVSEFEIPFTIKVGITDYIHCSDWLNAGKPIVEVIEMDFKAYVKNVLPNEWINTWHPESLKSGAIATKMFAWWRMTLLNPRPQGADVVDNTCDQVFFLNSSKPSTDAAIDATWHYRMHRDNDVIEIHYLAHDWQCENAGWEMCLGQWGSQEKALEGWTWEAILHFYYDPVQINITTTIIPNVNVILNGTFDTGIDPWKAWGDAAGLAITNGVLGFYRPTGATTNATVYQDINYRVPAATPFQIKLKLGNSSSAEKVVSVHLHNADSWSDAISCLFTLPPNIPLQNYTIWGNAQTQWAGIRLEVLGESDDNLPSYLVDNVRVIYKPAGMPSSALPCDAPRPGKPIILQPLAATTHGKNLSVILQPGASNLRPNYVPAYQVQISTSVDFPQTNIVFDNSAALSSTPQVNAILPTGTYFVRARQFDGIDRYSKWSSVVSFAVLVLPGKPTLIAPLAAAELDTLVFTWTKTDDTTSYKLVIKDSAGIAVYKANFMPDQVNCAATDATVCALGAALTGVAFDTTQMYTWSVRARNADGKTKSDTATFTVQP